MSAENQEPQASSLPPPSLHGDDALFELIPDGVPLLKSSDVKQKLLQWNLNESLQIRRFRVKKRVASERAEELIAQFFRDERVRTTLSLPIESISSCKQPLECHSLNVSVTSLSFFDRLVDAGIVTGSGSLRRCLDEVYDGATASDLLKDLFVNPESEHAELFSEDNEQKEFIFQLLRALVVGGSMCQSDESFAPYERMAKLLYKALLSVKKSAGDRSTVQVTSLAYAVSGGDVFLLPPSRFSSCFVVLDPKKRWLTVWHNHFKPFWVNIFPPVSKLIDTSKLIESKMQQQHRVPIRLGTLRTSVRDSPAAANISVHIESSSANSSGNSSNLGAALFSASVARVCRVCTQNASRYMCPRCNAPYCSVTCYKRHGESCTERFYEEHVRDVVQLDSKSAGEGEREAQRKMNNMLARVKRFQDESASGPLGVPETGGAANEEKEEERQVQVLEALAQLALLDEERISMDDLTPAQRKQFLAEVAGGRLSQFIKLWTPWWLLDARKYEHETEAKRRQLVIEEVNSSRSGDDGEGSIETDDDNDEEEAAGPVMIESSAFPVGVFTSAKKSAMPASLDALLPDGRAPSPALCFHVVETLFSYALVLRTFNGDWQQDPGDAATTLLHLSTVLSADAKFESIEHVLHACLLKRIDTEYDGVGSGATGSHEVGQRILHDVTLLLRAKVFVLDALSDAQEMLVAYKKELEQAAVTPESAANVDTTKTKPRKKAAKERRHALKKLALVDRKLQFFQTWAFHTPERQFQSTAREIERTAVATEALGQ